MANGWSLYAAEPNALGQSIVEPDMPALSERAGGGLAALQNLGSLSVDDD